MKKLLLGLRARLFLSYLVLLVVTLSVITGAVLIFLNTREAPPQASYQRLATVALSINLRQVLSDITTSLLASPQTRAEAFTQELTQIASDRDVRILVVNLNTGAVLFDTQNTFPIGTLLGGEYEAYTIPATIRRGMLARYDALVGSFRDPGAQEWLFVGLEVARAANNETIAFLFADPRVNESLQSALGELGSELLPILAQSALAGLVIALLLAIVISRGIAKPLQTAAGVAGSIARGHYSQRVPVSGPGEVRDVAEAFNQMSATIQAEQQTQQDFLANVSHDLKTPLTSIQGYSQAIIDGATSDPVEAARIIHEEAERMNRMVVELTDLARLQSGRLTIQTVPIDLGKMANAVGQRLAIVAREKGVSLSVDAPSMPEINGDGDRLVQVLTNLISNAIQFTPTGGAVSVKTQVRDGGVEVVVHDTGIGIPPDELTRVFERFYQVDKARGPRRGTGLGLAIVQEIVQLHGGSISAASAGENRGSTFTVWLPSPQLSGVGRKK